MIAKALAFWPFSVDSDCMNGSQDAEISRKEIAAKTRDVLRVIYQRGMVRAKDLKRLAALDADDALPSILRRLERDKIITVQGGTSGSYCADAYVAPLPSKRAEGESVLAQACDDELANR